MSDPTLEPSPRSITDALTALMLTVQNHQWNALASWFHPLAVTLSPTGQILAADRDACASNLQELAEHGATQPFFSEPPVIQVVETTAMTIVHFHLESVREGIAAQDTRLETLAWIWTGHQWQVIWRMPHAFPTDTA